MRSARHSLGSFLDAGARGYLGQLRLHERIALELTPALLALRTRLLVQDIVGKFRCHRVTALRAVESARRQT